VQGNGGDGDAAVGPDSHHLQTDLSGPVAHALVVMSFVGSGVFYATSGGRSAGVSRLSLFAGGTMNAVLARARGRARHGTLFMSFGIALALSRSGGCILAARTESVRPPNKSRTFDHSMRFTGIRRRP
jgi:hypothetical protein